MESSFNPEPTATAKTGGTLETIEPFAVFDCSLARYAIGRACTNLRELLDAVRTAPDEVLEHHMMRCALEDYFELYEFPNDLARWCWDALGDKVLSEQLGLIDPYHHTLLSLRSAIADAIEERLWGADRVPWCRPGFELHLVGSRLIAFDTGERLSSPAALAEAMPRLSTRSLFHHVHEARRNSATHSDDFSTWLERYGVDPSLVARIRSIDFYFLNLNQLRHEFIEVFRQHMPESQAALRVSA
jgi:hypothetical protein